MLKLASFDDGYVSGSKLKLPICDMKIRMATTMNSLIAAAICVVIYN